jgi:predicted RNA-binding Zn ribbon-like protein
VSLLNSRPHAIHGDRLHEVDWALENASDRAKPPNGAALDRLRGVRAALVDAVTGPTASADRAWSDFSSRTEEVTLRHVFGPGGSVLLRQTSGDPYLGAVAAAVADLVESGTWTRVKFCANPDCNGAFYDATRSRTQRWDSYETCGNKINVASHRARHGAAAQ